MLEAERGDDQKSVDTSKNLNADRTTNWKWCNEVSALTLGSTFGMSRDDIVENIKAVHSPTHSLLEKFGMKNCGPGAF